MVDIRQPLESFLPRLVEARETGLGEAETVKRVTRPVQLRQH